MPELPATGDVTLGYTNYRGERGDRRIRPISIWHGKTEWHPEPQWLLRAWDCEKMAMRDFAMADIYAWNDIE